MSGGKAAPGKARLRDARPADLDAIQAIYAHHVTRGMASFELVPPDLKTMTARYEATLALDLPYIVAELAGQVRGYALAGLYNTPPATASRSRTRSMWRRASSAAAWAGCCWAR